MCSGGERRVVEFLENESRKPLLLRGGENESYHKQRYSFWEFLCEPDVLGRELFVIEKFGLVQYVSRSNWLLLFQAQAQLLVFELVVCFVSDDPQDLLCLVGIFVGASRCLW